MTAAGPSSPDTGPQPSLIPPSGLAKNSRRDLQMAGESPSSTRHLCICSRLFPLVCRELYERAGKAEVIGLAGVFHVKTSEMIR